VKKRRYRRIHKDVGRCQKIRKDVGGFIKMSEEIGRFIKMLGDVGGFIKIFGGFIKMSEDVGGFIKDWDYEVRDGDVIIFILIASMHRIAFNEIAAEFPDLLVIAGEYSSDEHMATLVKKLQTRYLQSNICAIGGDNLEKTSVDFLFNMVEFCVVGVAEVLRNLSFCSKFLK
jgi:hypothetical protein